MALVFYSEVDDARAWRRALERELPGLEVRIWPEIGDPREIETALVWRPPPGWLARFPNLKAIFSLGAGVEDLLADPALPDLPLCRMVDPSLEAAMCSFLLAVVLHYHREFDRFEREQRRARWRTRLPRPEAATRVGVMGLGALGRPVAERLRDAGFAVRGWSRTRKSIAGVASYAGRAERDAFLRELDILLCLLPLTPETEGILNAGLFARLPRGAVVVNVGRGRHLVEQDLVDALDRGHLRGAWLDTFREEPLPPEHPFWRRPGIRITPHVAAYVQPESGAAVVAENIRRLHKGLALLHRVDRRRGY